LSGKGSRVARRRGCSVDVERSILGGRSGAAKEEEAVSEEEDKA
jgi:hypothetical protein